MNRRLFTSFLGFITVSALLPASASPVHIIFDTDIGNDIDDALALALLHALQSRGEAKLAAVTISKDNRWAAPYVDIVNTFYGRPDIPIGVVHDGKTRDDGKYLRQIVQSGTYPHSLRDGRDAIDAVTLLRRVLAKQNDRSIIIVETGFCTNLARLLKSLPDSISSLNGKELIRRKVRFVSLMGGDFAARSGGEYNIVNDLKGAKTVFVNCPVTIVVSGYEIGQRILYPASSIEKDFRYVAHHPIAEAYRLYDHMPYDRPSWDLTSVLYAVRPERSFPVSQSGSIEVTNTGRLLFTPREGGLRRHLWASQEDCDAALVEMTRLVPKRPQYQSPSLS